ncbi:hypothetical protein D3C85_1014110 [compost metagenome]
MIALIPGLALYRVARRTADTQQGIFGNDRELAVLVFLDRHQPDQPAINVQPGVSHGDQIHRF